MRILTLTTLYPNSAAPTHGVFVENRMDAFRKVTGAEVEVVAPVPWFPFKSAWAGSWGAFARTPPFEVRRGVSVHHPRYAIPPKIGMTYAASSLERCFMKAAQQIQREGRDFDLIDAHYLYPDGVAAVKVARALGKPVVITARGTDVNLIPQYARQRAMILKAVNDADAVICVAAALRTELIRLGAPAQKISVLRNGVDLERFRPHDRKIARATLDVDGKVILSVGHLIERKGHHLAIEALASIPDATLLIAGDGPERQALERQTKILGVAERVRFLGRQPHDSLPEIYSAADVLVLASSREGWPNVLLEAMACGTPAVASPVWGSGEVIREPAAGALAESRSAPAISKSVNELLAAAPHREATRRYAEKFSWRETAEAMDRLFASVIGNRARASTASFGAISVRRERPALIVTIDTEEEFDWSQFKDVAHRVSAPTGISRFQSLASRFGIRPIYFLTYPLIQDRDSAALFRSLRDEGAADLGLHLHQWATPPETGHDGEFYSYQCNLPRDVHLAKPQRLADAFADAFGLRARAHRAGRYGIAPACYADLAAIGVDLDFSPSVGFDFSGAGGPDFTAMSNAPFTVAVETGARTFVTPVCGARAILGSDWFLPSRAGAPPGLNAAGKRQAAESRYSAPMRVTCEGATIGELKSLTKRLIKDGVRIVTFSLHSTTMTAGGNQYARDEAGVGAALDLCERYFQFFADELGGDFITLDQLAAEYGA